MYVFVFILLANLYFIISRKLVLVPRRMKIFPSQLPKQLGQFKYYYTTPPPLSMIAQI